VFFLILLNSQNIMKCQAITGIKGKNVFLILLTDIPSIVQEASVKHR